MERIIDVSRRGAKISLQNGRLEVETDGDRAAVPVSDLAGLVLSTDAVTVTGAALAALAEAGIVSVLCRNHQPVGFITSLPTHEKVSARQDAQLNASVPLRKRLWQRLIGAKISAQAEVCQVLDLETANALRSMAGRVRSGDPDNLEAQAAQRYWPALFGRTFTRGRGEEAGAINGALNYGYAVLRAMVARAVSSAGLLPSRGLMHRSAGDGLNLADDLMEPLRPRVDWTVATLAGESIDAFSPATKQRLVEAVLGQSFALGEENVNGAEASRRMVASLVEAFIHGKATALVVPRPLWR